MCFITVDINVLFEDTVFAKFTNTDVFVLTTVLTCVILQLYEKSKFKFIDCFHYLLILMPLYITHVYSALA